MSLDDLIVAQDEIKELDKTGNKRYSGKEALAKYLETGRSNYITSYKGARSFVESLPRSEIESFLGIDVKVGPIAEETTTQQTVGPVAQKNTLTQMEDVIVPNLGIDNVEYIDPISDRITNLEQNAKQSDIADFNIGIENENSPVQLSQELVEKLKNMNYTSSDISNLTQDQVIELQKIFQTFSENLQQLEQKELSDINNGIYTSLSQESPTQQTVGPVAQKNTLTQMEDVISSIDVDDVETKKLFDYDGNQSTAYLSFSKKAAEAIKQLSDYYGDAGDNINNMFLQGKTAKQILGELDGQAKIDFQNFLRNTRQGQYLASLSDVEMRSMTIYTDGSYKEINGMLRLKKNFGIIQGMYAQRLIDNMDAAIAKYGGLEVSMELYRAVELSAFTSQNSTYSALFDGIDANDLPRIYFALKTLEGKEFGDLGYMSTSPGYSTSFAKYKDCPIVLDIMADEGTSGAYINQISKFYNKENEFLLARNTRLKMVEVLAPKKDINGLEKIVVRCVVKKR